ncbi:hypothetical protein MKW94_028576 [Papaver nudicaule]|uniref:Uncharacterized protein n=1 Tax=Papaver nudicaule TaxID=74823 RepID=A0AA41RXF9_PAPNU|nr:hypothetical protein [Papaver nudicaule]
MKSLSSLGIGLSIVFGCLLLALIAEIYYLLWWKRRIISREIEEQEEENHCSNSSISSSSRRELFYLFCWKKPSSLSSTTTALNPLRFTDIESQTHCVKPYGDHLQQDDIENELMRLHSISGPTRLLFTIKEETREDLESEDGSNGMGKFGSGRSDLIVAMETPYLTPLSSPPFFTPPMTPLKEGIGANCCYNNHGFNPLFESSTDVEISKIRASPPPKFKFLKDAEEKLYRKTLIEDEIKDGEVYHDSESENGSSNYITILVSKNRNQQEPISSSSALASKSKVKPLASSSSSTSSIRSINVLKPMFHLSSKA